MGGYNISILQDSTSLILYNNSVNTCHIQENHTFQACLHVVISLSGTLNWGLYYPTISELKLTGYCDSNYGTCAFKRRSLTGYCVFPGNCRIPWKKKKQKIVFKSSCEAEYRCMSQTTSELVWIHGIFEELKVDIPTPIDLFCDNKATFYLAHNPIFHERTKHLGVDCHYVKDNVEYGFINTLRISSYLQLANLMTKSLGENQHNNLSSKLGLLIAAPT